MTVYLVGAGPGDPGLLTVKGAEVLGRADVVVHDRLAEPSLLDLAPPAAARIDVGKTPGGPVQQDTINDLLVEHGRAGRTVVRLKGGDPFVFGRGGEEAQALLEAGVAFEVVPGVTAAVAAAAYAGIPLTHRGLSTSFTLVTGHSRHGVDHEIDWHHLAQAGDTIVVYMGVAHRAEIAQRLVEGGRSPDTPVAAVRWGTRPDQRTTRCTLATLGDAPLEPPCAIVIGEVAGLDLTWFESRPLFGRSVVVTRAREQSSSLVHALKEAGAAVVEAPAIRIEPVPGAGAAIARALEHDVDWIVLASANAVDAVFSELRDARSVRTKVAAIGATTADALRRRGIEPDLVPDRANAKALVARFPIGPGHVLVPQADRALPDLRDGLASRSWNVSVVEAYRTVNAEVAPEALGRAAAADAICFTSGSTVEGWLAAATPESTPAVVATIGPVTTAACERAGLRVSAEALTPSAESLVAAVIEGMGGQPRG